MYLYRRIYHIKYVIPLLYKSPTRPLRDNVNNNFLPPLLAILFHLCNIYSYLDILVIQYITYYILRLKEENAQIYKYLIMNM